MTPFDSEGVLGELTSRFPRSGRLEWIGVREARRGTVFRMERVFAETGVGLRGDHYQKDGKRQVTLIQQESFAVIAAFVGRDPEGLGPEVFRRNLVVSGINLVALIGRPFRIGEVLFEGSATCPPCSRMEEALGRGAYNAMRGHGGIAARVLESGWMAQGDRLHAGTVSQKPSG